jgi:hypothetical protein
VIYQQFSDKRLIFSPVSLALSMAPAHQSKTVTLRMKKAKPSPEQHKQSRIDAQGAAEALQSNINTALGDLCMVVETLALQHNRSEEFITEQLHLGGHVLKQRRAPGINNAYAYCEAQCEDECQYPFHSIIKLSHHYLYRAT